MFLKPFFTLLTFFFSIQFVFSQTDQQKLIDSLANQKAQAIVKQKLDSIKIASTKPLKLPPAFTFQIGANSQFNAGNISRFLISSVNRLQYHTSKKSYKLNFDLNYIYGEKGIVIAENDWLINFHHSFWYERRVYGIVFTTYESSNLRGIRDRYLGGAGIGWQIVSISAEKAKNMAILPYFSLTNAIIYEQTDFTRIEGFKVWRNSTRLLLNINFFKNRLIFNNIVFLQPSFLNPNFRASWSNQVRFPLHSGLSFQVSTDYSYESIILTGRQNSDWRVLFGFTFGTM